MQDQKALQFNGTAGGYFVVFLVTAISSFIPLFGTTFAFNYASEWLTENTLVGGQPVAYKAGYGETLKFLFINLLLVCITFGIYSFWFVPKSYRYIADHISYGGGGATPAAPPQPPTPPTIGLPGSQPPSMPRPPLPPSPIQ